VGRSAQREQPRGAFISKRDRSRLVLPYAPGAPDAVNVFDTDAFVLALTGPAGYAMAFPACEFTNADINPDGALNVFEIGPFVALLTGPEPRP